MVKSRKSKYIFVVAIALCLIMAFSTFTFAASGVAVDLILEAVNMSSSGLFFVSWYPKTVDRVNQLNYSYGFSYADAQTWQDLNEYLRDLPNSSDIVYYDVAITGIAPLFDTFYHDTLPINTTVQSQRARLSALEQFAGKTIHYYWNSTDNNILVDSALRPCIYIEDASVTQKEVANIPVQAAGNTVLNEDNRNYYYDQSSETTEIYEGDTITYEGDEIINEGDTITTNNYDYGVTFEEELIDLSDGIINLPGGEIYQIEDYIYNNDSDTYYFSTTNNNQTYNFTVQYFYEYTYVIYLGSSEEYKPEAYKFYYELPDGRSSADLTVDELAGMSVQFSDVVTYDKVASDDVVKGLWHLDGSIENSTVYSDKNELFFEKGASISYIEDQGFEGALYLPALAGARTLNLVMQGDGEYTGTIYNSSLSIRNPAGSYKFRGGISMKDGMSLDFRFYSYAAANDNTVYLKATLEAAADNGNNNAYGFKCTDFLQLCGNSIIVKSSSTDTTYSVASGTWNHLLLNFYLTSSYKKCIDVYLNGVFLQTLTMTQSGNNSPVSAFYESGFYKGIQFYSTSNTVPFVLDEIRITSANVPNLVSPVPYEDNLVWVLPDSTNLAANTLAIQSDYLSGKYRVGGIRPSMVEKGHVWFQISMNRIVSCQVYNGIMWEEVNCYVWTGSRWIPANYFDVVTLTDYYDIADNTGLPTITTSEGFFSWFQREFKEFKDKAVAFFDAWEGGGSSAGGNVNAGAVVIAPSLTVDGLLDANISIDNEYQFDLGTNAGNILKDGFDGVSGIFRGFGQLTQGSDYGLITNFGNAVTTFFNSFLTPDGLFGYLFLNPFE